MNDYIIREVFRQMEYLKSLWTDHPIRVKISVMDHPIKWMNSSATDGIPEILVDGSSYKGENIYPMNGWIYYEVR